MKKRILSVLLLTSVLVFLCACSGPAKNTGSENTLTVLNYGKYMDEAVIEQFENETGITVKYEEYESPEEMYTKYKAGSISYDVICSSEYMVERLINENEVMQMDFEAMDNYKNLDPSVLNMTLAYDKKHQYSVPYFYGTLGLLYRKDAVTPETVSSWDCLWDPTYEDEVIMENSERDSFAPALISLGYSINDTDETHLNNALEILKQQKKDGIVYAYYVDEICDSMISEEARIALCYSGEAALAMQENDNLGYSVPEEGSNFWIDSWFIPKSCNNQKAALMFLNFICREDIAEKNFDYVQYATPITEVKKKQSADVKKNEAINPSQKTMERCELFSALSDEESALYSRLWQELLVD